MTLRKVLFFRHGQTDWNAQERFQGHIDVPLNALGREQARALVPALKQQGVQELLSSDLSRARDTAQIIASELGVPVVEDVDLREAHLGDAEGKTLTEIEAQYGKVLAERWRSPLVTDADISYPGGETGEQVFNRAVKALENYFYHSQLECVGVATHGGVIRRLMQRWLPPPTPWVPIPNGVLYLCTFNPASQLPRGSWEVSRHIPYSAKGSVAP